jgi:hypothetical protein
MKPFVELTREDMHLHPVWRYCSSQGDIGAVVQPDERRHLSEQETVTFVVATVFHLADGSELIGLCSPSDPSGLDYLQPVILTEAGHLRLWNDDTAGTLVASACNRLGRPLASIFPVLFECTIPVDGVRVAGTVDIGDASPSAGHCLTLSVRLLPSARGGDERPPSIR